MANFTPTKKQVSDFNNGIKYVNKVDTPSADDFNNVIESQLYSQNFAESIADTTANPNLLINGDFAINQRGESSYTGVASQYTVDRWIKRSTADTVTVLTKGIRFTYGGSTHCWLNQPLEPTINKHLLKKTLTLSIKVNAVSLSTGASCRIAMGNGANAIASGGFDFGGVSFTTAGTYSGTVSIPSSLTNAYLNVLIQINNGTSGDYIDIEYAKLELGSISTPFVPPLTAEELLKCQRYYFTMGTSTNAYAVWGYSFSTYTGTAFTTVLSLPATLRVYPTVITTGQFRTNINGASYPVTGFSISRVSNNQVFVTATIGTSSTFNWGQLQSNNDASCNISFDAEIY